MTGRRGQRVGLCLMKSEEAEAVVEHLAETCPAVTVEDHVTFYLAEADGEIVLDLPAIADRLGRPLPINAFLVVMSSYIGRVVVGDDSFRVTAEMLQLEP